MVSLWLQRPTAVWVRRSAARTSRRTVVTTTTSLRPPRSTRTVSSGSSWSSSSSSLLVRFHDSRSTTAVRSFSSSSSSSLEENQEPRDQMAFDVLIVGGGPAGLAAGIRVKQLCLEKYGTSDALSVCLIDKGSEIGAHILSGNVFDPKALEELLPQYSTAATAALTGDGEIPPTPVHWTTKLKESQGSIATPVADDQFSILTASGHSMTIPNFLLPQQLHNHGNYILSLSQLCRWLAEEAEALGVEIYPGFAASEVLLDQETGGVKGIATRDVGVAKDGSPKATFARGVELVARQTLFAEGARGSCSEFLQSHFSLRQKPDGTPIQPQSYGLGIKEVWEVPPEQFKPGFVQHTLGFPLQSSPLDKVFGGTFLYHQEPNLVLAGLVVGLDYENPYLNPYQEFQQWKTHPEIKKHFEGGTCISYGARVLNEGGYHAIPKVTFPGGALIGCSAGFLNAVKIKGSHTALKSGMLAAEAVFEGLLASEDTTPVSETGELSENHIPQEFTAYTDKLESSWIYDELYQVRNCHQAFSKWGVAGGLAYNGLATHITKGREPWTLSHTKTDAESTKPAANFTPKHYPPPDGTLTFDLLTNLQRSGTYHADDQPAHLRIKPECADIPKSTSLQVFAGPEQRFCPAGVYEYVDDTTSTPEDGTSTDTANSTSSPTNKKLVINAQNCVHCKCCSIKMPQEYINWTVPEGGGGPQYQVM